jgi:hypothetical protein
MSGAVRYDQWMRRIHLQQLGAWGEHWADLRGTAQYAAWCRLAEERRAAADVDYYIARGLLAEVIYAAGGVERELERLRAAMAEVQRFADESRALYPLPPAKEWPRWGRHVAAPAMREASYSFANLLSWARSTVERTDRPFKPGGNERAGLLPALAAG